MMSDPDLATLLSAGNCLIGAKHSQSSTILRDVLQSRLLDYNQLLGRIVPVTSALGDRKLEEVQSETAHEALYIVEQVQKLLVGVENHIDPKQTGASTGIPLLGTRDLAEIRTLLSIAFKWGSEVILSRLPTSTPSKKKTTFDAHLIDLTTPVNDLDLLASLLSRILHLVFPLGVDHSVPQTLVTNVILTHHVADVLRPAVHLAWLPNLLINPNFEVEKYKRFVLHFLSILSPPQAIAALGSILSLKPSSPHVIRCCASLLSQQLLRPEGIRGLCDVIFGELEEDQTPLDKLEHVSKLLSTVPSSMEPEAYFRCIVPRLLDLLCHRSLSSHKRAAAFTLSRMLLNNGNSRHHDLLSIIILPMFQRSFLEIRYNSDKITEHAGLSASDGMKHLKASQSLEKLSILLMHTDPSPVLLSTLLSPIFPAMYAALFCLDNKRTSDPLVSEGLRSILETWGRLVTFEEATSGLWFVINDQGGQWEFDVAGELKRVTPSSPLPALSLLTPNDFAKGSELHERDLDLNLFNTRPDPRHFVRYVTSLRRSDVASEIFVRLLEAYRFAKLDPDKDPIRTLLYLQIIMEIQEQMTGAGSLDIFKKPDHLLLFVKHVLVSTTVAPSRAKPPQEDKARKGVGIADLRFISTEDCLSDDSEGTVDGSNVVPTTDLEMLETALNLLLAILEANSALPENVLPILNDISSSLLGFVDDESGPLQILAKEARLIITARLASVPGPRQVQAEYEDSQVIYQKALKLLQDPILPVRAHGLLLLRQLVTKQGNRPDIVVDHALVPAILSIFLQSVEHDDSYMFLNAVQGLAAMADSFGMNVLKGLVALYVQGLDGPDASSQHDVDKRLRIGEALSQVIRRCGEALPAYADTLVPPIFRIVRSPQVPTTLRTSSLSLLADCGHVNVLSLLPYTGDLFEGVIDLLQIESASAMAHTQTSEDASKKVEDATDAQPMFTNPKSPPLRRAALHFLSRLFRATDESVAAISLGPVFSMKRARATLAYIASTDPDMIVRVMAQEAVEDLRKFGQAIIGLS